MASLHAEHVPATGIVILVMPAQRRQLQAEKWVSMIFWRRQLEQVRRWVVRLHILMMCLVVAVCSVSLASLDEAVSSVRRACGLVQASVASSIRDGAEICCDELRLS